MVKEDDVRHTEAEELMTKQSPGWRRLARSDLWNPPKGDKLHILVLFFLYCLQGIPIGLCYAIPLILETRGLSKSDQATFSICGYPFAMKVSSLSLSVDKSEMSDLQVLWAPLVDSLFIAKFGRRKSWLVPVQLSIGG